jgi:3-hydroxy-9,10-secoandrosta-1,3,5(10)-triene-9,17-dione monooxygenase reductase component
LTTFDPKAFRSALGRFATGVTVVTTRDEESAPVGVTANSFNSVSLDPPMVLWSLARSSSSMPAFTSAHHFAVHILAEDQQDLSNRFAARGTDKFSGLDIGSDGPPHLPDCSARFLCRTAFQYEGGDHVIFVGEVIGYEATEKPPLLFLGGRYAGARRAGEATSDTIDPERARVGEESLIHLIASAHTQIARHIHRYLEECGLAQPRLMLMIAVGQHDHPAWPEIQQRVAATGYAATPRDIAELVDIGWMREADGRYALTDEGRSHYFGALSRMKALEDDFSESLTPSEIAEMRYILRTIIAKTHDDMPSLIG